MESLQEVFGAFKVLTKSRTNLKKLGSFETFKEFLTEDEILVTVR